MFYEIISIFYMSRINYFFLDDFIVGEFVLVIVGEKLFLIKY